MPKTTSKRNETRYIRELRKQITKLRRENAQLKKRILRMENDLAYYQAEAESQNWEVDAGKPEKEPKEVFRCPECNSKKTVVFELRRLKYYRCENCESKGKVTTS